MNRHDENDQAHLLGDWVPKHARQNMDIVFLHADDWLAMFPPSCANPNAPWVRPTVNNTSMFQSPGQDRFTGRCMVWWPSFDQAYDLMARKLPHLHRDDWEQMFNLKPPCVRITYKPKPNNSLHNGLFELQRARLEEQARDGAIERWIDAAQMERLS